MLQDLLQHDQIIRAVGRTEFDGSNIEPLVTPVVHRRRIQLKAYGFSSNAVLAKPIDQTSLAAADIGYPRVGAEMDVSFLHEIPQRGTFRALQVEHEFMKVIAGTSFDIAVIADVVIAEK